MLRKRKRIPLWGTSIQEGGFIRGILAATRLIHKMIVANLWRGR
jgi:hypothetical protein